MSRGPGKWQRLVLAALDQQPAWYAADLLPADHTRAEYVALLRAVGALEACGHIVVDRYQCRAGVGRSVVVRRLGSGQHRDQVRRVSVEKVP